MTPGQKKVAEYIADNLEKVSFQTIAQIAKESGVSETTVIRFSYAMGYPSFSDMQTDIQNEQIGAVNSERNHEEQETDPYHVIIRQDIETLEGLLNRLDPAQVDAAAKLLAECRTVYSVGFRNSSVAATWFANTAQVLRPNVRALTSLNLSYSPAIDADEDTVGVAIFYSRYSTQTVMFCEHIKSKGGKLILITDSVNNPLAGTADFVFIAPPDRLVAQFNCMPAAFTMLNILLSGITKYCVDYKNRLKAQDALSAFSNSIVE